MIFYLMRRRRESRNYVFRLMAGMLEKGLPLARVLESLAGMSPTGLAWLKRMAARARAGSALSDIVRGRRVPATPMVKSCIAAGEKYGVLPRALALACELDDGKRSKNQRIDYIYALFLLWAFIVVFYVQIQFIHPVLEETFHVFGSELPAGLVILISVGKWLKSHLFYMLGLLIVILFLVSGRRGFERRLRWKRTTRLFDLFWRLLEKLPLVGKEVRRLRWWRPIYGAGALFHMGVPLEEAVIAMGEGLRRPSLVRAGGRIAARLKEGGDPAEVLSEETALPADLKWIVAGAGADLPRALIRMGAALRELANLSLGRMVFVANQLIILTIALFAGAIILLHYLALFKMPGIS